MSEVKELPKGWEIKKLGKVCKCVTGTTPPKNDPANYGSAIPFVKPPQLFDKPINDAPEKLSEQGANLARVLPANSVLVTCIGNLGRTAINKIPVAFNQQINAIIPPENLDGKFLFYQAQTIHFRNQLEELSSATTVAIVNKGKFETIDIVIAPPTTQAAIVSKIEELFSELDKGIESLRTAQQQLRTYRQSVLKWAFEGKLTGSIPARGIKPATDGSNPLPTQTANEGLDSPTRYNTLPEGWKWAQLGEVCHNVEYGSATKSKPVGKVPVLRMGNIQDGKFDWDDLVYTDNDEEIKKYLLKKNDVLFNRTNSAEWVGKTAIYKGERPAIFAGYLIRINRIESLLDAKYLTYFLNTHFAKSYGNTVRSFGVNQSNINGTKLKGYPLPLAPLEEQQQIVEEIERRLTVADKMEEGISQSLLQSEALRQSILKMAFEREIGE